MSQTIEITIDSQGQARVTTKGFSGSTCRDASRFIEQALGQTLAERLTPEFYHPAVQSSAEQRQQSG